MIGIFDSGIGGLTVVRALKALRPDLSFVYLGDTARTPYGTKSPETIRRYSEEAAGFLIKKGARAIIIACNTASSLAADHLREKFPGAPVFEVVAPAVEAALSASKNGRIGVIGTRATIASGIYEQRLRSGRRDIEVFSRPAPLLVSLVEEGWIDTPETSSIVGKYVAPLREEGIDALILGCTHYPLLKKAIQKFLGRGVRLVDSAEETARDVAAVLKKKSLGRERGKGSPSFFVTDAPERFIKVGQRFLGEKVESAVRIER